MQNRNTLISGKYLKVVLTNLIPQIIKAGEEIGTVILEDGKEEPIIADEDITIEAGTPVAVKMYARRGIIDERDSITQIRLKNKK